MYLSNLEGEGLRMLAEKNPAIKKALTVEEIFKKSELERRLYELREKAIWDHVSMMADAEERGRSKGRAEGRAEALQDSIIRLLQKRFKAGDLADKVKQVTDVEILDSLYDSLLDAAMPEEADEIVSRALPQ